MLDFDKMSYEELKRYAEIGMNFLDMAKGFSPKERAQRKPRTKKKEALGKGMKPKDNGPDKSAEIYPGEDRFREGPSPNAR